MSNEWFKFERGNYGFLMFAIILVVVGILTITCVFNNIV